MITSPVEEVSQPKITDTNNNNYSSSRTIFQKKSTSSPKECLTPNSLYKRKHIEISKEAEQPKEESGELSPSKLMQRHGVFQQKDTTSADNPVSELANKSNNL
ncbi:Uncharacterised protein [Legionella busanensis]|uniref:Uncharacterized protein n=1 Tax=Legionella busanensis TaxID=190655 RepID=A0A378JVE1_9GAMM|nr:hypothetical protein [Legionella busanensis]STX52172.1 Uncharacterised protein [Legionella busanensis]